MGSHARAVDDNQAQVVLALRRAGAYVQTLHRVGFGCPDLLVGYRRATYLLEVKDGAKSPSRQALTSMEEAWHRQWLGLPVAVVTDSVSALRAIGAVSERSNG